MSEYIISIKDLAILMAKCHGTKLVEEDGTPVCDQEEIAEGIDKPLRMKEIVRCRDCYFADEIEGGYRCDRFDNGKEHVTPNGFCAWAERRQP